MPYLPVVNPEVGYALSREIRKHNDEPYTQQQLSILDETNPVISVWIKEWSKRTKDPMGSMVGALCVYKMLESQAEVNQMMKELQLG